MLVAVVGHHSKVELLEPAVLVVAVAVLTQAQRQLLEPLIRAEAVAAVE